MTVQFGIALASNSGGHFSPRGEYREYKATFEMERPRDEAEYNCLLPVQQASPGNPDRFPCKKVKLETSEHGDTLSITADDRELERPEELIKAMQMVGSSTAAPLSRETMLEIIGKHLTTLLPGDTGLIKAMAGVGSSDRDVYIRESVMQSLADSFEYAKHCNRP